MHLLTIALALALVTPAKGTEAELLRLRQALGLTPEATLRLSSRGELPAGRTQRVAIATGLDTRVRDNLTRWTEEWNRKEGAKQGALTLVEDLGEAQVVLVRLLDEDKAKATTQTFVTPGVDPPRTTGTSRPRRSSFTVYQAPVHSYVLAPVTGGFEIVWREAGVAPVDQTDGSGREVWDAFRKLLKPKR
jgi:hypothetical protein